MVAISYQPLTHFVILVWWRTIFPLIGVRVRRTNVIILDVTLLQNTNGFLAFLLALENLPFFITPACRSFTPILAELYTILKEACPSHGLEIVFVSSDRDEHSFNQYFGSMPWLAIPFDESLTSHKQRLSSKYNIGGIPSLVVLDSMSGRIVINNSESRSLVMQTCKAGTDAAIGTMFRTNWLDRTPSESKEVLEMLAMSCDAINNADKSNGEKMKSTPEFASYLVRKDYLEKQERINLLTAQLIDEEAMDPLLANETAVSIEALSANDSRENLAESSLNGYFEQSKISDTRHEGWPCLLPINIAQRIAKESGNAKLQSVLAITWKYFQNCYKAPWNPKFRQFRLSFKVADAITMVDGGVELLECLGFKIYGTSTDYVATVPIEVDLDMMKISIRSLCTQLDISL
jgi:Thioredoxin-like/PUB domain